MKALRFVSRLLAVIVAVLSIGMAADRLVWADQVEVQEKFLGSGMTQKTGGYRPLRAIMSDDAGNIEKRPDGLTNPKHGKLQFGDKEFSFILDESKPITEGGDEEDDTDKSAKDEEEEASAEAEGDDSDAAPMADPQLYVDANADGNLTNDPDVNWEATPAGAFKLYRATTEIDLGGGKLATVNLYRFDPTDPQRKSMAEIMFYYGDFGYEFEFKLDDKPFTTFVAGALSGDARMTIDRDGNGNISRNFETAQIGEPFNFTGTTYEFKLDEGQLRLQTSDQELDQMPLPPDLRIGQPALEFTAKTLEGEEVNFPEDYAGKLVMLDFWATWCGPCIGEIPHMKAAYADWHDKGFEILGISFDQPAKEDDLKKFLEERELPWAQIYEGKGWNTTIGNQHDVSAIPFVLLVDGDTGMILATAKELRGSGLSRFIGDALGEDAEQDTDEETEKVDEADQAANVQE